MTNHTLIIRGTNKDICPGLIWIIGMMELGLLP